MTHATIVELPVVGPVLFERSRKAKRLSITVRPYAGVRVAVPWHLGFPQAARGVLPKIPWIERQLQGLREAEGRGYEQLRTSPLPDRQTARQRLAARLEELAARHGFVYHGLTVRRQKTCWGSCSFRNAISLNIKLLCLPEDLMDFIIVHELVHTRIKNHGPEFKACLGQLVANAADLRLRLRRYQAILHL